jgi:uncharacterized protein (TIGR02271 family)
MDERAQLAGVGPGMSVFDAQGEPLGPVEALGDGTFRVAGRDLPASAIARVAGGAAHLHLARAVLGAATDRRVVDTSGERVAAPAGERIVVPLAEERLAIATREVDQGEVLIRKRVIEEERLVPVVHRREEVAIVRREAGEDWPLDLAPDDAAITRIPIRGWEPVVGTEATVARQVVVEKARVAEDGHATGTVRRERATVDERYARARPALEQAFHAAQGRAGRRFAEAEPHVRAGFHAAHDERHAGRAFAAVESAVRQEYDPTNRHDDDAWRRLREEIRIGYEAARRD